MDAKISSIRLIKNENGFYWSITLVDDNGNIIGTFGDERYCSDIDFRNQTFNIMKILNIWDLLRLDGMTKCFPVLVDCEFGRINIVANSSGDYLKFDYTTGEVLNGSGCDISQFCKQYVSNIVSKSGVLSGGIVSDLPGRGVYSQRGICADLAYLGFEPVYNRFKTEEQEKVGATNFRTFVVGMLDLCNINELIQFHNYPEVWVKFDSNNNIIGIGKRDQQEYLCVSSNGYELSSKEKIK